MVIRRRRLLFVVLLGSVATASLAAVAAYIQRLPDPDTADRRGLCRWLVECDLKEEPADVQLTLMRRVERELAVGIDFSEVMTVLDADQRRRLIENTDRLASCWFQQAADAYFRTSQNQRPTVLEQQIDAVRRLGIMDQLSAIDHWAQRQAGGGESGPAATGAVTSDSSKSSAAESQSLANFAAQIARIQRWIDEAAPHDRPLLSQYFAALRIRLLADSFRQLGGLGKLLPRW